MKENRTVNRILAVLELIARHPEGLTLGQIHRMLDIPKATAYDFLQTLYKADAVYYKDPRLKTYVIGSKMFAIGSVYNKNSNLIEAAQFDLKHFADFYGFTVLITKRVNDNIIHVFKYQPKSSRIHVPEEVGTITSDFGSSAAGQCYRHFDTTLGPSPEQDGSLHIHDDCVVIHDRDNPSIVNIACPVRNFENRVVGVLIASDFAPDGEGLETVTTSLSNIASRTSRKLGYLDGPDASPDFDNPRTKRSEITL